MSVFYYFVAIVVAPLILLVIRVRKCYEFWKTRGVPSTSPTFLIGDIGKVVLRQKGLPSLYDDLYRAFPRQRMVGFYEFTKPNLLVRDPRLIESILIKDFSHFTDRVWIPTSENDRLSHHLVTMRGNEWKDLRAKFLVTFTANKMRSMVVLVDRCADIMVSTVREQCDAEDVDMKEIVSRFATDVIGCCVFGLQFNTLLQPDTEFRKIGQIIFKPSLRNFVVGLLRLIAPKVLVFLQVSAQPKRVERFFENLLRDSKEFRKRESARRADLMQLILDIQDQDQTNNVNNTGADVILDDSTVLSNIMLFYAAGFETTANALSFCLYELAIHPEIQNQLRVEVQTILKANNGLLTYDILKSMTFTEMVICETLRKYNPVGFLLRMCTLPYQLPGTSCVLQPGDKVTIPIHSLHHDEKYYPNPEKFDPDRFTPENIASRPPQTFFPFGDGPRMCLAVRFAKMEMKLCLARILSQYKFSPGSKTEIPIKLNTQAGSFLTAKNGIHLRVSRLSKN